MFSENKFVGFNSHRLKEGDEYHKKEVDFVETFHEDTYYENVEKIVFSTEDQYPHYPKSNLTNRELKIVMSTIQWLGTPVGQGFLEKVKNKENEKH